jgi:hypothetical protein
MLLLGNLTTTKENLGSVMKEITLEQIRHEYGTADWKVVGTPTITPILKVMKLTIDDRLICEDGELRSSWVVVVGPIEGQQKETKCLLKFSPRTEVVCRDSDSGVINEQVSDTKAVETMQGVVASCALTFGPNKGRATKYFVFQRRIEVVRNGITLRTVFTSDFATIVITKRLMQ